MSIKPEPTNFIIEQTAMALCAEVWEQAAVAGLVMKPYRGQKHFVKKNFTHYIPKAIEYLIQILNGDYPDQMKMPIYEALVERGDYMPTINGNVITDINKYMQ